MKKNNSTNIPQDALIIGKAIESTIEPVFNWEQMRVNAAINAMAAMLASPELLQVVTNPTNVTGESFQNRVAKVSVRYADALIAELKNR